MSPADVAHYGCGRGGAGIGVIAFSGPFRYNAIYVYDGNLTKPFDPVGRGGTPIEAVRDLWNKLHETQL